MSENHHPHHVGTHGLMTPKHPPTGRGRRQVLSLAKTRRLKMKHRRCVASRSIRRGLARRK